MMQIAKAPRYKKQNSLDERIDKGSTVESSPSQQHVPLQAMIQSSQQTGHHVQLAAMANASQPVASLRKLADTVQNGSRMVAQRKLAEGIRNSPRATTQRMEAPQPREKKYETVQSDEGATKSNHPVRTENLKNERDAEAGIKQMNSLTAKQPLGASPLQLKRDKVDVEADFSSSEKNLSLVTGLNVKTFSESEKAYNDSYDSGLKITNQLENRPSKEENRLYLENVEKKLNKYYEDLTSYNVNRETNTVPTSSQSQHDDIDLFGDGYSEHTQLGAKQEDGLEDFFDLNDIESSDHQRAPSGMDDVDIHPKDLKDGEKVRKYNINTRRQNGSGDEHYQNRYLPEYNEFVAHVNYGENDKEEAKKNQEPTVTNADIIAAQIVKLRNLQMLREEKDRDIIKPMTIKREKIVNPQTLNTILWCDGSQVSNLFNQYTMQSTGTTQPEEKDYIALLGSPNGRAAGWLSVHYSEHLGLNPLKDIRYDEENLWINFVADVEEEPKKNKENKLEDDEFM